MRHAAGRVARVSGRRWASHAFEGSERAASSSSSSSSSGSGSESGSGVLLREWVHEQLYSRRAGYFQRAGGATVGTPSFASAGSFTHLAGEGGYRASLAEAYAEGAGAWLTPVEMFSPHYARAVLRHVLEDGAAHRNARGGLTVFEVGPGNGTHAVDFLDALRQGARDVYARSEYTLVEISGELAARQRERLARAGHLAPAGGPPGVARIVEASCVAWPAAREGMRTDEAAWVLGFEVLDNLEHDRAKVPWRGTDGTWDAGKARQAEVVRASDAGERVVWRPLADARVREAAELFVDYIAGTGGSVERAVEYWGGFDAQVSEGALGWLERTMSRLTGGSGRRRPYETRYDDVFLPTGALAFLASVRAAVPRARFVLADFHSLPDAIEGGFPMNAPVVQRTGRDGTAQALPSLVSIADPGTCDIFFPTDFGFLAHILGAGGVDARVVPQVAFLAANMPPDSVARTTTRDGYNPALEDFRNASVLLT